MSQPTSPDRPRALRARRWPAPAFPAPARHQPRARRRITAVCLTLAVLLTAAVQLTAWAEGTLLSTSGFAATLGTLPRDPAVQAQVTDRPDAPLCGRGRRMTFEALHPAHLLILAGTQRHPSAPHNPVLHDPLRTTVRAGITCRRGPVQARVRLAGSSRGWCPSSTSR